jgi:hypothetical protein
LLLNLETFPYNGHWCTNGCPLDTLLYLWLALGIVCGLIAFAVLLCLATGCGTPPGLRPQYIPSEMWQPDWFTSRQPGAQVSSWIGRRIASTGDNDETRLGLLSAVGDGDF